MSKIKYTSIEAWFDAFRFVAHKRPQPVLTFPIVQRMGFDVDYLVKDAITQALGIKLMCDKYDMPLALGYMDLSVEAEAFGANCVYHKGEVPTITGCLIEDEDDADALVVPEVGAGRTGSNVEGIAKTLELVQDRPVIAGCIGPFSLAGRLVDVNEAMILCYEEPDMMETVLEKATEFIIKYIKAYKEVGAHGVLMAEPLAGILSPNLAREFSHKYVKQIIDECQDKNFVILYHNCGGEVCHMAEDIFALGCKAYHFGNSIDMRDIMELAPSDVLCMGNVSPSEDFQSTKAQIRRTTMDLLHRCYKYDNFWLSSGCDIPPMTPLELIDEFFAAAEDHFLCDSLCRRWVDGTEFVENYDELKSYRVELPKK